MWTFYLFFCRNREYIKQMIYILPLLDVLTFLTREWYRKCIIFLDSNNQRLSSERETRGLLIPYYVRSLNNIQKENFVLWEHDL